MTAQIIRIQMGEVLTGALPFINTMAPIGISHELKELVIFDQRIQQAFRILIMHIVIPVPWIYRRFPRRFIA